MCVPVRASSCVRECVRLECTGCEISAVTTSALFPCRPDAIYAAQIPTSLSGKRKNTQARENYLQLLYAASLGNLYLVLYCPPVPECVTTRSQTRSPLNAALFRSLSAKACQSSSFVPGVKCVGMGGLLRAICHAVHKSPSCIVIERGDFRCVPCQPQRPFTPNMDPSRVSESDGGGGPERTPLTDLSPGESSVSEQHDPGRVPPRPPDTRDVPEQSRQLPVLSLDQIRVTGSSNEYTDGPTAPGPQTIENPEERHHNLRNLQSSISSSSEEAHSPRSSSSSPSSGHRLLGQSEIIRIQPKRVEQSSEELKPLTVLSGSVSHNGQHKHWDRCEECGRCRCAECVRPRVLPSCWMCGRRCMCSAHSAVEYCTCVCCIKGLFYHCSSDDEDTCADKPFSCSQPHCCARWSAVSLLALLFPCLLCYLPARACVSACQSCYDRASRPGCRCKNSKLCAQDLPT
ncbi:hypothetical protein WMY93_022790 [Mugilogobius chulae]|uniref:Protein sprouty homolog 2 n=1 Tax=Mugilogobius chulae TaxID=88201 RepID=A0AAW0N932_9GOBI